MERGLSKMKFSHSYSKLNYPVFTTIRQNKGYYEVGQRINIYTPELEFQAEIVSIRQIIKRNITFTMAQRDADCHPESLVDTLETWYGKRYDNFILITLMKI